MGDGFDAGLKNRGHGKRSAHERGGAGMGARSANKGCWGRRMWGEM